jgi:hypothetical protein
MRSITELRITDQIALDWVVDFGTAEDTDSMDVARTRQVLFDERLQDARSAQ